MINPVQEIMNSLASGDELTFYNATLQDTIEKIEKIKQENLEQNLNLEADNAIRKLLHRIETNNHIVFQKKAENPSLSIFFCAETNDSISLKFLLRTGENPNEVQRGKAAIHIAAARGHKSLIPLLKACPATDLNLLTSKGKSAWDLAANQEIHDLLGKNQTNYR